VYIKGNPEGRDALRMAVNTFLIKSQKYQMIAVDAIDVIAEEQNRQRGGSVSDEDIALLGRDAGAQYVCVVERSELDGISYVSTSIVSVQSKIAELSEMSELPRGGRIIDLIEKQINTMLGIYIPPEPEPESQPEYIPEYANEYTPPPKAKKVQHSLLDEQSYSAEPYAKSKNEARVRLGVRLRGGIFSYVKIGSELFGKSYTQYEEMGESKDIGCSWCYLNTGLTLNIKITDMINLASELNYSLVFHDFWYGGNAEENFVNVSMSYQTIEVPVLLRLILMDEHSRGAVYGEAGFQFGFPISSKATVNSGSKFPDTPFKYEYSDFRVERDYGIVFGFGLRGPDFSIGPRFTFPLTKLDKYGNINAPIIFSLTFAYDFFY